MDYNLGRAHGKIEIEYDDRAARRASDAVENVAENTRKAAKEFKEAERTAERYEKATVALSKAQSESELRSFRHAEAIKKEEAARKVLLNATQKAREAEEAYDRIRQKANVTSKELTAAERNLSNAREKLASATENLSTASRKTNEAALRGAIANKTLEASQASVRREYARSAAAAAAYGAAVRAIPNRVKTTVNLDVDQAQVVLKQISTTIGGLGAGLGKATAIGGGGLALGGMIGLLGAGGLGAVIPVIAGATNSIIDMAGALGTLPGLISGAVVSMKAMSTATMGFDTAMAEIGKAVKTGKLDMEAFNKALEGLSPAAQDAALNILPFTKNLTDMRKTVQDSFFSQIVDDITPLAEIYIPLLREGLSAVAGIFGQAASAAADFLKSGEGIELVGTILGNVQAGLQALLPYTTTIVQAFLKMNAVSSAFLPRLAQMLGNVIDKFSAWVNGDGFVDFIETGINAVSQFLRVLGQFGSALGTIFKIADSSGGGFLGVLEEIGTQFNNWTKSVEGQESLKTFFDALAEASKALGPAIKPLAGIFGTIATTLAKLGTQMGPGLAEFFTIIGDALAELGKTLTSGPTASALSDALVTLANAFAIMVKEIGPSLPNLFRAFADALEILLPVVPVLAKALGWLADNINGELLVAIGAIIAAFYLVAAAIASPIAVIVGAVVVAVALIVSHWDLIKETAARVMGNVIEFLATTINKVIGFFTDLPGNIGKIFQTIWDKFTELPGKALEWGRNLINNFVDGMTEGIRSSPLGRVVGSVAEFISDFWKTESPSKKGPLSKGGPNVWGSKLVRNYVAGMEEALPEVNAVAGRVAGAAARGLPSTMMMGTAGFARGGISAGGSMDGFKSLVSDIREFNSLGRGFSDLLSAVFENVFDALEQVKEFDAKENKGIGGGNPMFKKPYERTVSDEDLADIRRRKTEDEAYSKLMREREKERNQLPTSDIPNSPRAQAHLDETRNTDGAGATAAANNSLDAFARSLSGATYLMGGFSRSTIDCSGAVAGLANVATGRDAFSERTSTMTIDSFLAERGFVRGKGGEGDLRVGWYDNGGGAYGHTAATLPNGMNFESSGPTGARFKYGANALGANADMFTDFMYLPGNMIVGGGATPGGFTPGGFNPSAAVRQALQTNPDAANGGDFWGDAFGRMPRTGEPAAGIGDIASTDEEQLSVQEQMLQELLTQNGLTAQMIEDAKDPTKTTDAQAIETIELLENLASSQEFFDTAESRENAQGMRRISGEIQEDRGITEGQSPMEKTQDIASGVFSIATNVFESIDSVLNSIEAASDITATLVKGIQGTEDIYGLVDNVQVFIETAAQIASTVGSVLESAGAIAAASGGMDGGSASAGLAAASAVANSVSGALQTVNQAINLGQEVYRVSTKYLGQFLGNWLGGAATGDLQGNVKMLLNTQDWTMQTYSQDNPDAKNTFDVPAWARVGGDKNKKPTTAQQNNQVNIYAGPGQSARDMLNESMWIVNTGNLQGAMANANF